MCSSDLMWRYLPQEGYRAGARNTPSLGLSPQDLNAIGKTEGGHFTMVGGSILLCFGDREGAKEIWLDMARRREGGITPYVELAKYYEHTAGDLDAALEMTLKAIQLLSDLPDGGRGAVQETENALEYRYDRLRRKRSEREAT